MARVSPGRGSIEIQFLLDTDIDRARGLRIGLSRGHGPKRMKSTKRSTNGAAVVVLILGLAFPAWADSKAADDAVRRGDYDTALREFRALAEVGNPHAQYNIGVMYDLGTGVEQDRAKAVIWYRKAANQGHDKAQFNLGALYANGEGVSQELVLAYKWLELAHFLGHPEAKAQRDAVGRLLTPEKLAGARKLIEQWIKTFTQ